LYRHQPVLAVKLSINTTNMFPSALLLLLSALVLGVNSATLEDVCTTSYVQASLPSQDLYLADSMNIRAIPASDFGCEFARPG
jgi:hypothetical protein